MSSFVDMHGTCFISPHSDDTCMSATFILKESILPKPYFLLTVFTNTTYVDILNKDKYAKKDIMQIRKVEDKKFAEIFNMKYLYLNEHDCLKRYGEVIFNPMAEIPKLLEKSIYKKILNKIKKYNISNIVVPYPSGERQHFDHRIAKNICKKISLKFAYNLFYTDDLPYSLLTNLNNKKIVYRKTINKNDLKYKYEIMKIYKSQMCKYYYDSIKRNNAERIFL